MKMHNVIIFTMLFSILACTSNHSDNGGKNEAPPEALTVKQVMETPGEYIESQITVQGMVAHVCRHGGKRLHLSTPESDFKLRVRTGENISSFDRDLEGNTIQVSGKLTEERFDQSYLEKLKKGETTEENHESSEHDNASVTEKGVSKAYINELEQKIKNSEKGYISEYWLTGDKMTKKKQ
ncbi:MAG: hypothetical protein ACOCTU_00220 [Bacteroidota bacterium]